MIALIGLIILFVLWAIWFIILAKKERRPWDFYFDPRWGEWFVGKNEDIVFIDDGLEEYNIEEVDK